MISNMEGENYVLTNVEQHYRQVGETFNVIWYYAARRIEYPHMLRLSDRSEYVDGESGP